jgi:hypothetical protein
VDQVKREIVRLAVFRSSDAAENLNFRLHAFYQVE